MDELFDKFDAFGSNLENFPILKPNEKMSKEEIKSCVRWIPPFTGNFDEVKKERKEKELSEKYKKEFDSGKFEELINEKYRYYRADFECMSVKNYPAQPKF